ncbi:MAG: hypothetical protein ACWA42_04680 [Lutibacter sp.]
MNNNPANKFDIYEPNQGHFNRFKKKLPKKGHKVSFLWIKISGLAASILLLFGVWLGTQLNKPVSNLSAISSKMSETESFFISTIQKEKDIILKQKNHGNAKLISDAFLQLKFLENQYNKLNTELNNNQDNRIIYAMISNYQQRITILQHLLDELKNIKNIKTQNHEKTI